MTMLPLFFWVVAHNPLVILQHICLYIFKCIHLKELLIRFIVVSAQAIFTKNRDLICISNNLT